MLMKGALKNLLKLKMQNKVLSIGILGIVMKFCYFVMNIKENIKYAAKPQSLALSHESRKDRTNILNF